MKNKDSIIYSIWKIFRLLILSSIAVIVLNLIILIIFGKLSAAFTNYSIVLGVACGTLISIKLIEKKKLADISLSFRKVDIAYFISGIFAALVITITIIIASSIQHGTNLFPQLYIKLLQSKRSVFTFMTIPLAEEIIYRSYILNNTFLKFKFLHRSIISAAIFSITHWSNPNNLSLIFFIFSFVFCTFIVGLLLNLLVHTTKSIWCGFGFHWFQNFFIATLFMNTSNYNLAIFVTSAFLIIGLFALTNVKNRSH